MSTEKPRPSTDRSAHETRRWPWWHERSTAFRRVVRTSLALVVTGLLAVAYGTLSAQFTGSLGPHVAQYSITLNAEVTVDMGPLGSLIVDSPLPLWLGVDVLVQEIPEALSSGSGNPVAGLTADLSAYSQFLANPEASIREAATGLVRDAVGRTVLAWSILLCLIALGRLASHGVLRGAARSAWRQQGVPAMAVGLTLALLVPVLLSATRGSGGLGRTSEVLAGTPLEDARITGRLGEIVDYYGGYVVDAIRENDEFYATVTTNLRLAYEADTEPLAPLGVPTVVATLDPATDAATDPSSDDPTSDGTEEESEGATSAEESSPADEGSRTEDEASPSGIGEATSTAAAEPDPATLVMVTDLHCNVGMAPVIGEVVDLTEADVVVNAGDTVMSGTSVESACVNAFADGIPAGVPVVVADGNHDSAVTGDQEAARGWLVLAGQPVVVAGITFLGDSDPVLNSIGSPAQRQRDETFSAMGERLADVACTAQEAGNPIDILLVHNPTAAEATLAAGCAPLTLNGHRHRRIGPWQHQLGLQYVSSSTAGATSDAPTIGPLAGEATITVLRWDRANDVPLDFRIITVAPDGSVTIEPWQGFPPMPQEPVDLAEPEPGQAPWDADPG